MDKAFFRPCNGEVGLTPATRAIVEANKKKEAAKEVLDPYNIEGYTAAERLMNWRKK